MLELDLGCNNGILILGATNYPWIYSIPGSRDVPKSPPQTSSQLFATLSVINKQIKW